MNSPQFQPTPLSNYCAPSFNLKIPFLVDKSLGLTKPLLYLLTDTYIHKLFLYPNLRVALQSLSLRETIITIINNKINDNNNNKIK